MTIDGSYINDKTYYDDTISENEKLSAEYFIANIDNSIASLVRDDPFIQLAYNYFEGNADPLSYAYLTENHGIGTPASVPFIPLIKPHINYMIGVQLSNPLNVKVTCNDHKTIDNIITQKANKIFLDTNRLIMNAMKNGKGVSENDIKAINDRYENFISTFEETAQDLIGYVAEEKNLKEIVKNIALHLFISGKSRFRTWIKESDMLPEVEVYDPRHVFFEENPDNPSGSLKTSRRVVHRMFLSRSEVMNRYGHYLTDIEKDRISVGYNISSSRDNFLSTQDGTIPVPYAAGYGDYNNFSAFPNGYGVLPKSNSHRFLYNTPLNNQNLIEVFHVEWLANNEIEDSFEVDDLLEVAKKTKIAKKRYRLDRYEGVRILGDIYVGMGRSLNVVRKDSAPHVCTLSYDGVNYESLILLTRSLQDRYNILHYFEENMLAVSGTKAVDVNPADVPSFITGTEQERIMKYLAYIKLGIRFREPAMPGDQTNNTMAGVLDMTLSSTIQYLESLKQSCELNASRITGVPPQAIGMLQAESLVGNNEMAVVQTTKVTKSYFNLVSVMTKNLLTEYVNLCRFTFNKTTKYRYSSSNSGYKMFTIDPDKFSMSDYNVFITDGGEEQKDIDTIKQLGFEFIKNQQIGLDTAVDLVSLKSLTKVKEVVKKAIEEGKGNQLQQLQQQIQQQADQLDQANKELKKLQGIDQEAKQKELELKEKQIQINEFSAVQMANYNKGTLEEKRELTKLERDQEIFGSGKVKEVNNSVLGK